MWDILFKIWMSKSSEWFIVCFKIIGGFLRGFKMTNYPGPQEALDWWESDCRNTDGGKPKKKGNVYYDFIEIVFIITNF